VKFKLCSLLLALVLSTAGALHAQKPETEQRLTFPGIAWGEPYARTASVLQGMGFAPAGSRGASARAFANARGDSLYAGFDDGGGLEAMTFAAHLQASEIRGAFDARAQQLREALGEPDSASARLTYWSFPSGDQLFLAREGGRLVEFYFSAEARAKVGEMLAASESEGDEVGSDDADAWYAARILNSRWEALAVGTEMGVAFDPATASRLSDGTLDVWTRWDHAEYAENDDGSRYSYTIEHQRIDCSGGRMMTLQLVEYDGTRVVKSLTPPQARWEPTVPETMGEQVIQAICSAASGRRD